MGAGDALLLAQYKETEDSCCLPFQNRCRGSHDYQGHDSQVSGNPAGGALG